MERGAARDRAYPRAHGGCLKGGQASERAPRPTGEACGGKAGALRARAGTRSRRTRRSYQAAWPVTGSEFDQRCPSPFGGRSSWIRWLRGSRGSPRARAGSSAQAPGRLPMAFQVQTVERVQRVHAGDRHGDAGVRRDDVGPVAVLEARAPPRPGPARRAGSRRGSGAARRSASPRSGTSPPGAG